MTVATGARLRVGDVEFDPEPVDAPLAPGVWVWQVRWDDEWERDLVRLVNAAVVPSDWAGHEPPVMPSGPGDLCYTGTRYVGVSGWLGWQVSPTAAGVAAIPGRNDARASSPYRELVEGWTWMWCHEEDARLDARGDLRMARAGTMFATFGAVDVEVQIAARAIDGLVVEVQAGYE